MLSVNLRKQYFEALGYTYNKEGIKKLQSKYMARKKDVDGVYGRDTDILLKNLYNFKLSGKVTHFSLKEFKCGCNGKYCNGYPAVVHQAQLSMMEAIRKHWGKSITITCGLRCSAYNKSLGGSVTNSKHKTGYATDYYIPGVTDALNHRLSAIRWIKTQKNHTYTYGNGCNSYGNRISAPYMGNALHTDTNDSVKDVYKALKKSEPVKPVAKPKTDREQMIDDMMAFAKKYADNQKYHYKKWNSKDAETKKCPICAKQKKSQYLGWNCIGFATAICYHGGGMKHLRCSCSGLGNDGWFTDLLAQAKKSTSTALKTWKKRNGTNWTIVWNNGKKLTASQLKAGDVCLAYSGNTYKHTFMYAGNGYIYDSTSGKTQISKRKYSSLGVTTKLAFRPTGRKG